MRKPSKQHPKVGGPGTADITCFLFRYSWNVKWGSTCAWFGNMETAKTSETAKLLDSSNGKSPSQNQAETLDTVLGMERPPYCPTLVYFEGFCSLGPLGSRVLTHSQKGSQWNSCAYLAESQEFKVLKHLENQNLHKRSSNHQNALIKMPFHTSKKQHRKETLQICVHSFQSWTKVQKQLKTSNQSHLRQPWGQSYILYIILSKNVP